MVAAQARFCLGQIPSNGKLWGWCNEELTLPPTVMPDRFKLEPIVNWFSVIAAYRRYYAWKQQEWEKEGTPMKWSN